MPKAKRIPNKILSVTIKRMIDESPDTSHMGEYSNESTSRFTIDRKHSLDCYVNRQDGFVFWCGNRFELKMTMEQAESCSHSGECDDDVKALSEVPEIKAQLDKIDKNVLAGELKKYGAWDADELANHDQNLRRILWLACGDITDNHGCDCGEQGDWTNREYQYFNPSFNYVTKDDKPADGLTPEEVRKYVKQDYARMEAGNRGDWCAIGIRAEAEISGGSQYGILQRLSSGGLWGLESDMSDADFAEVEQEQLADLRDVLVSFGFGRRAIAAAFKNVQPKDGV